MICVCLDAALNALDVHDNTTRRRLESDHTRARSASSSPRHFSADNQRAGESHVKPASLYVSNWTDDEKAKRSKDRMNFNESQLAVR